jgi:hypothetical protein
MNPHPRRRRIGTGADNYPGGPSRKSRRPSFRPRRRAGLRYPEPILKRLVLATALLAGCLAHASSIYPAEIRTHLGLSYTPDCSLCHANGQTGFGTVTTPFGTSMRSRGLVSQNIASLDTALDALDAEKKDSDGDGVPDIDELKAGSDPNVAGGGSIPPPSYGCFDVTGQSASPLALLLPVALALLLLRARRT